MKTQTFGLFSAAGASLFIVILLAGCIPGQVRSLDRSELFRLDIGRAENEIDLFQVGGGPRTEKTGIFMRDGLVYIGNGPSNKVMEFTSYGDLLTLWYDPDSNPRPIMLQTRTGEETVTNKRAHDYAFSQVGDIAVTEEKMLVAEDQVSDERSVFDEELGVTLNRILLRFDPSGELLDYIGQEGVGGTPFPFIEDVFVTAHDEIVVTTRTMESWLVFWYDGDGNPLYNVELSLDQLPVPEEGDVIPQLETIIPDQEQRRLYLKLDYYEESHDPDTGASYGINRTVSRIYWLELESGKYEGYVDIPRNTQQAEDANIFDRETVEYLYRFVGTAPGNHLYLLSREEGEQTQLLIMHTSGRVVRRRNLRLEDEEVFYKDFSVSPEGILTALIGFEDHAQVTWWRSDRLIGTDDD
ncbi:MAG: LIC_12708 family protein [Spirochaetaceae bacterium]